MNQTCQRQSQSNSKFPEACYQYIRRFVRVVQASYMPLQVFSLLNILKKKNVVAHGGWPHATVVAHSGYRPLPATFWVLQLPSPTVVGHGSKANRCGLRRLDLQPLCPTAAAVCHGVWWLNMINFEERR
jgi:hypothetical protein